MKTQAAPNQAAASGSAGAGDQAKDERRATAASGPAGAGDQAKEENQATAASEPAPADDKGLKRNASVTSLRETKEEQETHFRKRWESKG